uniref:AlNc14C70G4818 protein n=1 Tax=Albugo laibachii Nc14 TaxID=890382 RepID=F0WDU9_9STRA|nr:AlNc14C70G4818 [Albugo laibachii Nc14]|eukprot:CCA19377.1 AlNc14C70G4818 [Albugo laibachii Nc14]
MKYPTSAGKFVKTFPDVFEYSKDKIIQPDAFDYAEKRPTSFDDAEYTNTIFWDSMIRSPFEDTASIMEFPIQVGRSTTDESTTVGSKRPDFLIWTRNALVLKGEEEGSLTDMETAKYELLEKR